MWADYFNGYGFSLGCLPGSLQLFLRQWKRWRNINCGYDFDKFTVSPAGTTATDVLSDRWNGAYQGIWRSNIILA
ncbi:hypothetical protein GCM10007390_48220 [Persicitalea jodogahamensis]|uniref:Uncharacterized protein n=1 Tax=Persicitalea jodogahamensis TaxID=402147 RepID=A0A8J3D841_9BACT|nr:hypothetical protein GCM10007390_48220 [Persicitalea jodogahamensis]